MLKYTFLGFSPQILWCFVLNFELFFIVCQTIVLLVYENAKDVVAQCNYFAGGAAAAAAAASSTTVSEAATGAVVFNTWRQLTLVDEAR